MGPLDVDGRYGARAQPDGNRDAPSNSPDTESVHLSHLASELLEVEKKAQLLITSDVLGPHPRHLIAGFSRTVERLQIVINHLRGNTQAQDNTPLEQVHLSNAVIEAMRGLQDKIREADARVLAGTLPVLLICPRDLVTLFHHLIDNALKFRSEKPPSVTIRAHEAGSNWIISVSDNGRGMTLGPDMDPFKMFSRLPNSDDFPGTGIGLAVCQQIAKRYSGDIWYESESGRGTTLYVRFKAETARPSKVEFSVSFNAKPVGKISVSETANKAQITKAALALPVVDALLGEETIQDVQLLDNGVINIVS